MDPWMRTSTPHDRAAAGGQTNVGVIDSGDHPPAGEIDSACRECSLMADFVRRSHGQNVFAAYGESFDERGAAIGDDFSVGPDYAGALGCRAAGAGRAIVARPSSTMQANSPQHE